MRGILPGSVASEKDLICAVGIDYIAGERRLDEIRDEGGVEIYRTADKLFGNLIPHHPATEMSGNELQVGNFIDGTKDTTSEHMGPIVAEMEQAGFCVSYHLLEDGHMFPLHRATIARIAIEHFSK